MLLLNSSADLAPLLVFLLDAWRSLWQAFGGWRMIGAAIIILPLLRKMIAVLRNMFKGGL